jgi:hypothetical protein
MLISMFTNVLFAQSIHLQYPLKIAPSVSSSFGTFRNSHHHAGLDLYAYETTPVIASADGVISLIKRSSSAYGRVLYINHANGYQTVYGHLSAFAPKIDRIVRQEEKRTNSFKIKMYGGKRLTVKAGEIIGWAGTSGTDLVHLHYELRKNNLPVNPLTNGLKIPDQIPPQIKMLYLQPKSSSDWLNDGHQLMMVDPKTTKIPHFKIWGDIRLAAQIEDYIDGSSRELTPYQFYLEIDHQKKYHILHEENSYAEKGFTKYDFDLRYRGIKPRLVNRLYAYGPKYRQQKVAEPSIFKHLKVGKHQGQIVAIDAKGNQSKVPFTFEIVKPLARICPIHLQNFERTKEQTIELIKEASFTLDGLSFPIAEKCLSDHEPIEVSVKINGEYVPQVQAHFSQWVDDDQTKPNQTKPKQTLALTLNLDPKTLYPKKAPHLLPKSLDLEIGIRLKSPTQDSSTTQSQWYHKRVHWIKAGQAYVDDEIRIQVLGAPFEEHLSAVTELPNPATPDLKALTPIYRYSNPAVVTNGTYKFWIKRGKLAHGDHTGAFVHQEGKFDWASIGWHTDELSGHVAHLGDFSLMEDIKAPIIYPPTWLEHPAGPRLILPFIEKGSEISRAEVQIDGKPIQAEYQRSWQRFVFHPTSVIGEETKLNPKMNTKAKSKVTNTKPSKSNAKPSKSNAKPAKSNTKPSKSNAKPSKSKSAKTTQTIPIFNPAYTYEYLGLSKGKHQLVILVKDRTGHLVTRSFEFEYPPTKTYTSKAQWPWEWWSELEKIYPNMKAENESKDHQNQKENSNTIEQENEMKEEKEDKEDEE